PKCDGQVLLTQVWKRLNLIECDYFGLEFQNVQSCWIWLEPMKPIIRQVRRPKNAVLRLAVKFFPPDPGQLQEEYTRYLFALQLKRDLLEERLTCTDTTAALLASHLLQAEVGDYDEALDREHLRAHEYVPRQERALHRILAFHRELAGQTPAESDFQVLEIARKLDTYGIRFHSASDREGAKIKLAVSHTGILVFQSSTRINTFNWSRLRKLSFKRKRFLIKLHPEVHGPYQDTLEFVLGSRDECKSFWKICVEHHTFFRLFDQPKPKAKAVLFSRGSSFRYSGRTQKQLADYVKDGGMKRVPYERRHSKTRMSLRALKVDLPRQSLSFSEGVRTPVMPSPTAASFCSAPASPPAPLGLRNSQVGGSSSETGPPMPGAWRPATDKSSVVAAQPPRPPVLQPHQGLSAESPLPSPSTQRSPPGLSPLGPATQGLSPLLGPVLSDAAGARMDNREEPRRKCVPADEAYFIAKEILATERTYLKDLEVITVWFRSAVVKADAMPADLMTLLFSNIDPIYEFHRGFLREVEQRLALWEESSSTQATGSHQHIGDILLRNMLQLKALTGHFQQLHEVLTELEAASRRLRRLEALRRDFELQKVCYLPLNAFLLKPLQRLRHYRLLLRRLCAPGPGDPGPHSQDRADLRDALQAITEVTSTLQHSLVQLENLQRLTELQRDLVGIESLVAPGRMSYFVYLSSANRHFGCFHFLATVNSASVSTVYNTFVELSLYLSQKSSGPWSEFIFELSGARVLGEWAAGHRGPHQVHTTGRSHPSHGTFMEESSGAHPRGLPPQAHPEGPAAEDVLPGRSAGTSPRKAWAGHWGHSAAGGMGLTPRQRGAWTLTSKVPRPNAMQSVLRVITGFCGHRFQSGSLSIFSSRVSALATGSESLSHTKAVLPASFLVHFQQGPGAHLYAATSSGPTSPAPAPGPCSPPTGGGSGE
ncbi:hypothetical protein FD754_008060, partial [Muntiacus muntjak]